MKYIYYCDKCKNVLPEPWDIDTRTLLKAVLGIGGTIIGIGTPIKCPDCDHENYYDIESIIDEIAERIDD